MEPQISGTRRVLRRMLLLILMMLTPPLRRRRCRRHRWRPSRRPYSRRRSLRMVRLDRPIPTYTTLRTRRRRSRKVTYDVVDDPPAEEGGRGDNIAGR